MLRLCGGGGEGGAEAAAAAAEEEVTLEGEKEEAEKNASERQTVSKINGFMHVARVVVAYTPVYVCSHNVHYDNWKP